MKAIYIFTRDLRTKDNTTLNQIAKIKNAAIIPIFVFTPEQVSNANTFKSNNAIQFMVESLKELDTELGWKLAIFYGKTETIVSKLIKEHQPDAIYITKDYTPYAKQREENLKALAEKNNVEFNTPEDYCLHPMNSITNVSGQPYQKYTPYYRKAVTITPNKPTTSKLPSIIKIKSNYSLGKAESLYKKNTLLNKSGGRTMGLKQLDMVKSQNEYGKTRNDLEIKTSELSAYIKFGNISIREVYWRIKKLFGVNHSIIAQLIWRDFYYQLGENFPHVIGGPLKEKYGKIKWSKNKKTLDLWKQGKTGYPIVDACMTQLNTTGYMHNRGRLIVASFLVKTLLHDWQEGEKYFARQLEDYDPLVNNGNWQWVSGSGADSQPYFRVFNPWLQSQKHDPNAVYIKKWLPELKDVEPKHLHQWDVYHKEHSGVDYPAPIVDYKKSKENTLKEYKKALGA